MSPPDNSGLIWHIHRQTPVVSKKMFTLYDYHCVDSGGKEATFSVLDSLSWVHIIAQAPNSQGEDCFIMVRQFRHGAQSLLLEFPGGIIEPGEDPTKTALRELREESGYSASHAAIIGVTNPNPAMMTNSLYTLVATNVHYEGPPTLDENERIATELVPCNDILHLRNSDFNTHALMISSLHWYSVHTSLH